MKMMIASDLHGSAYFCEKLLKAYENEQPSRLILLGDLLYHGPRNDLPKDYDTKKVIQMLNSIRSGVLTVRGNCDAEVDQMVLEFPVLAEYCVIPIGNRLIYAVHGHQYHMNHLPPLQEHDILLHGHTHIPAWVPFGQDNYYLNPGSVSIPKEGSAHGYMTMDQPESGRLLFQWKTLEGECYHSLELDSVFGAI